MQRRGKRILVCALFIVAMCALMLSGAETGKACKIRPGKSSESSQLSCEHEYSEWTIKSVSTCKTQGTESRVCLKCGFEELRDLPLDEHDYYLGYQNDPTCDEIGVIVYYCENCGSEKREYTPALGHEFEVIEQTPATCTENGKKVYVCNRNESHTYTEIISARGHFYEHYSYVAPSCTQDGKMTYKCANCESYKYQNIPATGHSFSDDNVCDNCGYVASAHTHDFKTVVTEPDCVNVGYTTYTCSCGLSYKADYIDQKGHKWDGGKIKQAATCLKDGIMLYSCTRCDETYETVIKAAHDWSETVVKQASCTKTGEISRSCYRCGAKDVVIIPAAHDWGEKQVITPATCTESGTVNVICNICSETQIQAIPALGHNYVNGVCKRCGEKFIENVTPEINHPTYGMFFVIDDIQSNYGPNIINEYGVMLYVNEGANLDKVAVYLTQEGNMWRRCIACTGTDIEFAVYVPYLSYGEDIYYTGLNSPWINTFALSEGKDGIWRYSEYATIGVNLEDKDGNLLLSLYDIGQAGEKTRIFDDLERMKAWLKGYGIDHEHIAVTDKRVEPTCDKTGLTEGSHCSVCGEILIKREVIPAKGHSYGGWVVDKAATCTADGSRHKTCERDGCGFTVTESIAKIAHTSSDWIIDSEATCENAGAKHKECTVCHVMLESENISALGHNYVNSVCTRCGAEENSQGNNTPTEGLLYKLNFDGKSYYCAGIGTATETDIVIASEYNGLPVTLIGDHAFNNCNITSVKIQNGVIEISFFAFSSCVNLVSVSIPNSVAFMSSDAIEGCVNLQFNVYDNVKYLGNEINPYVVLVKPADEDISSCMVHSDAKIIVSDAFYNCNNLQYNEYDNGKYLGNEKTPYFALIDLESHSVDSLNIHADTMIILDSLLQNRFITKQITVQKGNKKYHSVGNCIIETESKTLIRGCDNSVIPDDGSVTTIGWFAFYGCDNLFSARIPESVNTIYWGSFYNCKALCSLEILGQLDAIPVFAFKGCSSLESITIPKSVTSIGNEAFSGCSRLTSIIIPDSVTSISSYAFDRCSSLTSITIPDSVTSIGDGAFDRCDNLQYNTYDNAKYLGNEINPFILLIRAINTTIISCNINQNTKCILSGAFYKCSSLTSITIPESVTSIGDSAFEDCSGLTSIAIPDSVTLIHDMAFRGCYGIESIVVSSGNTKYHSAGNCLIETTSKKLILGCKNSIIPDDDSVSSINMSAFYGCRGLTSIRIPNSITSINFDMFLGCSSLVSIIIPNSVTLIYDKIFFGCHELKTIYYTGTEEQWNKIDIILSGFENVTIIYNYKG